jgi:hypothetical protein
LWVESRQREFVCSPIGPSACERVRHAEAGFFSGPWFAAGMQDSTNETNSRVLALAIRPVGKTALSSNVGKSQSSRTGLTTPAANSGAKFHSEVIARPR